MDDDIFVSPEQPTPAERKALGHLESEFRRRGIRAEARIVDVEPPHRSEEATTVEEVCEPFLVRAGMIARTPRGRVGTPQAWTHLGMTPPARATSSPASGWYPQGQAGLFE